MYVCMYVCMYACMHRSEHSLASSLNRPKLKWHLPLVVCDFQHRFGQR